MSPLHTCIACAVLQPTLRSLLIFDASFSTLQQISQQMVAIAAQIGQHLRPFVLGAAGDDDLWGERLLPGRHGKIERQRQLFSPPHETEEIPLIILPDLSALSLTAARMCIMLVGANIAHLERHGQQGVWTPRYYWLAACQQEEVGAVSPHLLDRFALRLAWRSDESTVLSHKARVELLQSSLQQQHPDAISPLTPQALQRLKQVSQSPPFVEITPAVCEHIVAYFAGQAIHPRRELALARCSLALAQLADDQQLQETHIDQAAELMGIATPDSPPESTPPAHNRASLDEGSEEGTMLPTPTLPSTESATQQQETPAMIEVETPEPGEQERIDFILPATDPYPEDTQPVLREAGSLQIPQRQFVGVRSDRGPIIGVEPTTLLRDLALVNTLLHALLFQAFRPKHDGSHLVLDWSDLRKYRRVAEPERLLLLLLDYTSMPLAQRQRALVPYLHQAYVERARVAIIKVGALKSDSRGELRAECVNARNILAPVLSEAIDTLSGSATPLAHGLELAFQVMQRALQHGRSTVQYVTFVVLSDGRGNVPLNASHSNTLTLPVTREGIEDALEKAREIAHLKYVSSVVLSPRPRYYQDVPERLADALNAQLMFLDDEGGPA